MAASGPDPLRVSLFLFAVLTLSRVHQHFDGAAQARPVFWLAAFAGLYIFLNPRSIVPANLLRTWPGQIVSGLAVLACLSVPLGIAVGRSARFLLEHYSKVLLFGGLLMVAIRRGRDLFLFVWAYVAACAILAALTLFVFDVAESPGGTVLRLNNLYTYDANDAGLVLVTGLPLTLLTLQTSRLGGKILSVLTLVGIGVAVARTGSRGAFLGLAIVGVALLLSWPQVSWGKRVGLLAAVALALAAAAPRGYWEQMKTLANPTEDYNWESINGRKAVALRGLGYMLDHPVFGLGIDNFARAEGTISEKAKEHYPGTGIRWTAPHNSFVQVGAEMGIPGLVLWSCLVFGGIGVGSRIRKRLPAAWLDGDREARFLYCTTLYLPIAFLGFAVTASFLSFAYMDPIYILAAYVTGLYASLTDKSARDRAREAEATTTGVAATA